ncbi:MAG: YbaB/EbfC family nucleoid-associated protein [Candidatus Staskawiczbacteria bacterium]|nr:YbaB/EbfC family nucleoid-associated protein [Candidatus Staskawiczbacteria bacterium]
MFDKLKQLGQLKKIQDSFKKETETVEKRGVLVTINGNFEVVNIKLSEELEVAEQQEILKNCLNEARDNIQKKLANQMMSSGLGAGLGF